MPRTRYTPEQIITKLRQAEVELARGQSAAEGCRKLGTSEQTYSRSVIADQALALVVVTETAERAGCMGGEI